MVLDKECVILVPASRAFDPETEAALSELSRRRYPVWRIKGEAPPDIRDRMAGDALAAGFKELFFIDPSIVFEPDAADRLRGRGLPVACGVYPIPRTSELSCQFFPGGKAVRFGEFGVPISVQSALLGFSLIRKEVFESIRSRSNGQTTFFAPLPDYSGAAVPDEGLWFCQRARTAGVKIVVDTAIRLWKVGPYRHGWENAGGDVQRHEDYTYFLPDPGPAPVEFVNSDADLVAQSPAPRPLPPLSALRPNVTPFPSGFPKIQAFIVTYPANRDSLALTLASIRESDWGEEPAIIDQPPDWTPGGPSAPANYKRALEAAAATDCDYALILEDDIRVNKHLRHNLLTLPLVQRDQCDYLSLFVPDLMADPWERHESSLGYRVAKPRYGGPDRLWEKYRVWGVQAILFSRRLLLETLARWDRFPGVQDARVMGVCGELGIPLFYSSPCWVDHAPVRSGYNTPLAYAPDFTTDFELRIEPGYHPPEIVPGWITRAEGELLWRFAAGRAVLEIGAGCGRQTVCLAQTARQVIAVDSSDTKEASEWLHRYGVVNRVKYCSFEEVPPNERFGLVVVSARDVAGIRRDLESSLPLMEADGLVAVHHYPDPAWPDVRIVFDELAKKHRWKRIKQVDYLGIFQI